MNKILVLIKKNTITFSLYNRKIDEKDINNTNIIDIKNLKFSEEYILDNLDLLSSYLNLLIIKQKVDLAIIKNNEIGETILKLLQYIKIEQLNLLDDADLSYTEASLLLENKYLKHIECYSMPELMFNRFNIDVKTRSKILFKSDFMKYNNIETYSDICNKEKIVIDSYLTKNDVDDILYFFEKNYSLKKITLKGYKKNNLIAFLNMLKKNNHKNVNIILIEESTVTNDLLNDAPLFNKLSKEYCVNIKIKYSKEYKDKNYIKELNLNLIKNIILIIILMLLFLFYELKKQDLMDIENTKNNLNKIDNIINQTEITKSNDEIIYDNLYKLNSDTIGHLKIKNTEIDYPVVQTKDNDYYLKHSFDKTDNKSGWIFLDYRNNINNLDKNIIIYGHSMKNRTMFGSLPNLLTEKWLKDESNYIIDLNLKGVLHKFEIFSVYITNINDNYLVIDFKDDEFINYVNNVKKKSVKKFNVDVNNDDHILTLSTCYGKRRLVVNAKLIK